MSTYFSKVIKAGERQREFNFRQSSGNDNNRYSVDVPDERGNRVMFSMQRNEEGQWKAAQKDLPTWIREAEEELDRAIEENRRLQQPVARRK
ncbi:MAG: hypothetical protein ACJ75B_00970 [Flavisolibacter sp.]